MYRFDPEWGQGVGWGLTQLPQRGRRRTRGTSRQLIAGQLQLFFCYESIMKEGREKELREAGKSVKSRSTEEGGGGSLTLRNSVM